MSIQDEALRIMSARDNAFDAVEAKGVTVAQGSKIDALPNYIMDIDTKWGDDVIFIDYDGTELYKYKASVVQSMTELPPNPTHTGLVSQGWNWTLAEIKNQLTNVSGKVIVGQMYVTESGATEIDIVLLDPSTSPYLRFALNGTATIDWGDGSASTTMTGTNLTADVQQQHVYASSGAYTIKINIGSGSTGSFYMDNTNYQPINGNKSVGEYNRDYSGSIQAVRVGYNMQLGNDAFRACHNLKTISIPNETILGVRVFRNAFSLQSLTVPRGITSITGLCYCNYSLGSVSIPPSLINFNQSDNFNTCSALKNFTIPSGASGELVNQFLRYTYSLESVVIPSGITKIRTNAFEGSHIRGVTILNGVTEIGNSVFKECKSLRTVILPNSIKTIGNNLFFNCFSLKSVTLPNEVTSIDTEKMFYGCKNLQSINLPSYITTIGQEMFRQNYCLSSIRIPSTVTVINQYAFYECVSLKEFHFDPTTPPILNNTNAFSSISEVFVMYIPYSEDHSILNAYKTATNWSNFASQMQEEPQ